MISLINIYNINSNRYIILKYTIISLYFHNIKDSKEVIIIIILREIYIIINLKVNILINNNILIFKSKNILIS